MAGWRSEIKGSRTHAGQEGNVKNKGNYVMTVKDMNDM